MSNVHMKIAQDLLTANKYVHTITEKNNSLTLSHVNYVQDQNTCTKNAFTISHTELAFNVTDLYSQNKNAKDTT